MTKNIIQHQVEHEFRHLRQHIYTHAKRNIPTYRWIQKLPLEQARDIYLNVLRCQIPTEWVTEQSETTIKVEEKFGVTHKTDILEIAKDAFTKAWEDVGITPTWIQAYCPDAHDQEKSPHNTE